MRLLSACAIALLLIAPAACAVDYMPVAELTNIFPLGAQIGTTVDVSVIGQHLDNPVGLVFTDPSITSELKKDAKGKIIPNTFSVTVPKSAKAGAMDVRVRGKFGISNPRRFCIGTLPEVTLNAPQNSSEKPAVITIDSVVNSSLNTGVRNRYAFHAAAKQRVFIHIEAPDTRFEPQLTLSDSTGRVVQRGTSALEFTAQIDGEFSIELHDLLYRGGADCRYRLILSTTPAPLQRTDAMASSYLDDAEIARVDSLAVKVPDVAPHNLVLTPPCEYIGMFPAGGQAATFSFSAKKGDVYWIDVLSHRLGHATDSELVLEKIDKPDANDKTASGEKTTLIAEAPDIDPSVSAAGFALNVRDGFIRFEAKDDGTHRVSLRDIFNTGKSSPRLPYCLSIRKEPEDFQLVAVPDQPPRARPPTSVFTSPPTLRRGGVATVRVFVQRQFGFTGDIALNAEGLPPGVTCLGAILGNADECASLAFYADEKAQPWAGFVRVVGTAKINGKIVSRIARNGSPVWTVADTRQDALRARLTDGLALAVISEEAPISIEPESPGMIEALVGSKISLKLKVTRRGGYDELVKVRAFVLGDQDKSAAKELDIPAKATTATLEIDLAHYAAKPGEHTFVLHGNADRVKYKKNFDELPAAEAEAKKLADDAAHAGDTLKKANDALTAAKQKSTEADAKLKQAKPEEKPALEALAKSAKDALAAADSAAKVADAVSKAAAQLKMEAEKRSSELAKLTPKDTTYVVFSKPIHIKITEPVKK